MTDRDYATIWIEELDPPYVRMGYTSYPWQNAHRIAQRSVKLAQNNSRGWHCAYCGELMPEWKRIDAKYCKEGCRKMTARKRRLCPSSTLSRFRRKHTPSEPVRPSQRAVY